MSEISITLYTYIIIAWRSFYVYVVRWWYAHVCNQSIYRKAPKNPASPNFLLPNMEGACCGEGESWFRGPILRLAPGSLPHTNPPLPNGSSDATGSLAAVGASRLHVLAAVMDSESSCLLFDDVDEDSDDWRCRYTTQSMAPQDEDGIEWNGEDGRRWLWNGMCTLEEEGREGGVRVRENGRVELKSREGREAGMQRERKGRS